MKCLAKMASQYLNFETYHHPHDPEHKEWVVFIHGAGGSIATWKYQKIFFAKYYNLLLIDLRDHGSSNVPTLDHYSFALITEDVFKVLQLLKIEKAHFITLSFGSVLLQHFSMVYPQFVQSAIFAGGIFKPNTAIRLFVFLARVMNVFLPYKWMYSLFSYLLMPRNHHQKSRKIYQKQAAKLTPKAYMKWVGLYQEFFQLLDKFYGQALPFSALVIMGEEDYVFLKSAKLFSSKRREVVFKTLSHAGHICNIDQPEAFNEYAQSFLHQLEVKA